MRYNSGSAAIQFCNGTSWAAITSRCNAAATTFSFTNQTGVATSTLTPSNILPIYGTDPSCNSDSVGHGQRFAAISRLC